MDKPLFFYQLPRTSSTSLTAFIRELVGNDQVFVKKMVEETYQGQAITSFSETPPAIQLRAALLEAMPRRAYSVMAPFGVHRVLHQPMLLLTVLRNPIERCLSLLRFMHKHPTLNSINERAVAYGTDYARLLADPDILCFRNEQTRMLSDSPRLEATEDDLAKAMLHLSMFDHVGRFGDFERIRTFILGNFGGGDYAYPKLNEAEVSIDDEAELRALLEEKNQLDFALLEASVQFT